MSVLELGPEHQISLSAGATPNPSFWAGRRVLVTGHTGFKGAWLSMWLQKLGAEVWGLARLPEDEDHNLFFMARVNEGMHGRIADLRNAEAVTNVVHECRPQIVFHLAAQALVKRAIWDPTETWATNVLGTQHLLEALRGAPELRAAVLATTDKVYANDGSGRPMRESSQLGGADPYSASKAACELLAASAARSYFEPNGVRVATVRAGNVVGGGDFAADRIAPDCVRAALCGAPVVLRKPDATRPWQHVLDCLNGYLLYAEHLVASPMTPRALNIGPSPEQEIAVVDFARAMMASLDAPHAVELRPDPHSIEAPKLSLDPRLAQQTLNWRERLPGLAGIYSAAAWYRAWATGDDMQQVTQAEIERFDLDGAHWADEAAA